MATLHLLGTGAALSDGERTTTMLAVHADLSTVVIDCGGDVVQRIQAAGLDLDHVSLLLITHEHADHLSGFPLFMEKLWLSGRRRPITVCGPGSALSVAKRIFDAFDTSGWEGLPEIDWRIAPLHEGAELWSNETWRITGAPGQHGVPVLAVRIEEIRGGGVIAYSADTSRSDGVARLAQAADILVHEATGDFAGHTSAQDAAHIAAQAGVGKLVLVHIPSDTPPDALAEARASFPEIEIGEDGASYAF